MESHSGTPTFHQLVSTKERKLIPGDHIWENIRIEVDMHSGSHTPLHKSFPIDETVLLSVFKGTFLLFPLYRSPLNPPPQLSPSLSEVSINNLMCSFFMLMYVLCNIIL